MLLQPACVALLCRSVVLNAGRSRAVTLLGTEFPCLALKDSAKTAITVSPPACDTWHTPCQMELKGDFLYKASVNLPSRSYVHSFRSLQGECKPCAVVRVPSGSADVPHLAVRLTYGILTQVCEWLRMSSAGIFCSTPA